MKTWRTAERNVALHPEPGCAAACAAHDLPACTTHVPGCAVVRGPYTYKYSMLHIQLNVATDCLRTYVTEWVIRLWSDVNLTRDLDITRVPCHA